MTKKRFVADNEYVLQDGGIYVVCGGEHSADVVATALNELLEENEQLRFDFQEFKSLLHSLEDENEQLKQQVSRVEALQILSRLKEENEQLKTKNFAYLQDIEVFKEENTHLKLENEQLKCENELLRNSLEMRNGKREKVELE